jgi:hypothetical protein
MKSALPLAAALLLLSPARPLTTIAAAAQPTTVIDAGGYLLAYTPEPGWEVKSNANAGSVIVQLIERESGRVAHLAEYRVLKITVPADQRSLSRDEVAQLLCAGDHSYAASSLFPAPLDGNLRKLDPHRIGPRDLAAYSYRDSTRPSPGSASSSALVYVWLPASFPHDGGLYLISAFVYLNTASAVMQANAADELKYLDNVVAAIKPK